MRDVVSKERLISDDVATFRGHRPMNLGDYAVKNISTQQ